MSPEKEAVNFWLNKNGFFTIHDINAGQNKIIDIVAIKNHNDTLESIQQVEIHVSISSSLLSPQELEELQKRFDDPAIVRTLKKTIKDYIGQEKPYTRVLVTTAKGAKLQDVTVIDFEYVLFEVIKDMDKQNYRNATKRTMQLMKYLVLANPDTMSKLFSEEKDYHAFTQSTREAFVRNLLSQDIVIKTFKKESNEKFLIELLKVSTMKQPERLAKAMTEILSKRSYNKFIEVLFKQKELKEFVKEELTRQQSSLEQYMK